MKTSNKILKIALAALLFPIVASAQLEGTTNIFEQVLVIVQDILIPIVFTLALLLFFWGVVKYIKSEGDGKAEGKQIMVWGVIALFVMSSVWAIVFFISNELGIDQHEPNGPVIIPSVDVR